jgi:hypothetical protein
MINILFYGNCQVEAVCKTLFLDSNKFKTNIIVCHETYITKDDFKQCIRNSDIIITQPISDNYRSVDYLSTKYVIEKARNHTKIIIFDSCYFNFYYPDLVYVPFKGDNLHEPVDYHYKKMIECYKSKLSTSHYIENYVNNETLLTNSELNKMAENSIRELKTRYEKNKIKYKRKYKRKNTHILTTYKFIKNNYKDKLLFYSMNHPTKYVIQYICEKIIKILNIHNTINYNVDALTNPRCIIYKCIQKNVNFDITQHTLLTKDKTDLNDIVQLYYDTYKSIGF